jgi:hypothetical protein
MTWTWKRRAPRYARSRASVATSRKPTRAIAQHVPILLTRTTGPVSGSSVKRAQVKVDGSRGVALGTELFKNDD